MERRLNRFIARLNGRSLTAPAKSTVASINSSRGLVMLFRARQDVPGRILEPGNERTAAAEDAFLVRFHVTIVIVLKLNAAAGQLVHGFLDVPDREIEDRECCRGVIGLGIDQHVVGAGDMKSQ